MNILAIDTSNLPLSVAVITEERVLGECTFNVERNHSIRLMPAIASLMEQVRLTPKDIDLFVVARGPGEYRGSYWCDDSQELGMGGGQAARRSIELACTGTGSPLF